MLVPPTRGVGSPGWGRRGRGEATGGRPLWKAGVRKSGYAYVLIPGVRAARLRSPPPVTTRGQLADAGCRGTAALRTWRRAWSAHHVDGVRDGGVRKDGKSDTVHGWYARGIPTLSHPPRHHSPLSHPTVSLPTVSPSFTGQGGSGEVWAGRLFLRTLLTPTRGGGRAQTPSAAAPEPIAHAVGRCRSNPPPLPAPCPLLPCRVSCVLFLFLLL